MKKESRLLLQALASGLLSSLLPELLPDSSPFKELKQLIPGLAYGLCFLIWLPGLESPSKRVAAVLSSALIYVAAYQLVMNLIKEFGSDRAEAPALLLAGALGSGLLLWLLEILKAAAPRKKDWMPMLAMGALLGLVFEFPGPDHGGALAFGLYFAVWQAGVGLLLYRQARKK